MGSGACQAACQVPAERPLRDAGRQRITLSISSAELGHHRVTVPPEADMRAVVAGAKAVGVAVAVAVAVAVLVVFF
jgi:hypothetical protein